jgi:hypothetical protein
LDLLDLDMGMAARVSLIVKNPEKCVLANKTMDREGLIVVKQKWLCLFYRHLRLLAKGSRSPRTR